MRSTIVWEQPVVLELTEEAIAEGMAGAEKVACYPFLDPLEDALASCMSKGRCHIG
jgi:hypothetical protein